MPAGGNVTNLQHGHWVNGKRSPTYVSWDCMIARCHRPSHPRFADYGGRGIRVCDRWRGPGGFQRFLEDVGERPAGHTLDRVDVDGPYDPGNVRWATKIEQRWNRRDMRERVVQSELPMVGPSTVDESTPAEAMPF